MTKPCIPVRSVCVATATPASLVPFRLMVIEQGSKIIAPVLDWSGEDLVVRSGSRGFGVVGSFSQCAFSLIV